MFLRRLVLSIVLSALLIGGGVLVAGWLYETRPVADRSADPPQPPMVHVQTVVQEDILEHFTGYGTARADHYVVLAAEVNGVIVEVAPDLRDGSFVAKDQMLVRIDDRRYRRQLERAEASAEDLQAQMDQLDVEKDNIEKLAAIAERELDVARGEMRRLGDLFEKEMANKREFDFARLAYEQSRRQLQVYKNQLALIEPRRKTLQATRATRLADAELARLDVERCAITAPFSGQVERLAVDIGDRVLLGSEVLRLMDARRIEIPVELPASVRALVRVGARCRLDVDSMPGVLWEGVLARIAPAADARSRTFSAFVEVDNTTQRTPLVPGYFVTARVEGPVWRQVLAVPRGAIANDHVYVVNGDRAHVRAVRIDRFVDGRAVVTGELLPGDRVILTNLDVLFDGADVRVAAGSLAGRTDDASRDRAVVAGSEP